MLLLALSLANETIADTLSNWHLPANLSDISGRSFQTSVAREPSSGTLFVTWTDDGVAEREEILGRRWDQTYQSWLPTENLSQSEPWQRDGGAALVFDDHGHGFVVWTRTYAVSQGAPSDGYDVLWRSWDGSAWSTEAVLLHGDAYLPGSPGTFGLIPVETSDSIVLFIVWGTGYRTTEYLNGSWSEPSPWTDLDVTLAQIIADDEGTLHAAAFGENSINWGYNGWFQDAYYLTHDGTSWSVPLNLSFTDGVANYVGLAFDGNGQLHFLWSDPGSPYSDESLKSAIWERVKDGASWTPNAEATVYDEDQAINGFSLTADGSGILQLAWSEGLLVDGSQTDLDIYYQTGDRKAWGTEEEVNASSGESRYPVVVAGDGAFIFWQEGPTLDRDVYFSRQIAAGPCQSLTEVSIEGPATGNVGQTHLFSAASAPLTATWPVTYTWQAAQQSTVIHGGGFIDTVDFTWSLTGTKAITVTAKNCGEAVTATHTIELASLERVYLPLITKE